MNLDFLMNQVKQAIFNDPSTPHRDGHDPSGLIGNIEGLFGRFGGGGLLGGQQQQQHGQVLPASQDPYGDPADMPHSRGYGYADNGNIRPSSEDPYGDPADSAGNQFPGLRPASEDPLGDPADDEYRRR